MKECDYLQSECDRVKKEKSASTDERLKLEETSRSGAERLRARGEHGRRTVWSVVCKGSASVLLVHFGTPVRENSGSIPHG